jgi:hypothetical protein
MINYHVEFDRTEGGHIAFTEETVGEGVDLATFPRCIVARVDTPKGRAKVVIPMPEEAYLGKYVLDSLEMFSGLAQEAAHRLVGAAGGSQ